MSIEKPDFTSIIKEEIPFTVLPNYVLQNVNCPIALAIWCHLISRPTNWVVNRTQLQQHFGIGKKKLDKAIKALIDMHLLSYHVCRYEEGYAKGAVKKVSILVKNGQEFYEKVIEQRILTTTPESNTVAKQLRCKRATTKERDTTKERNIKISSSKNEEPVDNSFEKFWENYPKKVEKIQTRKIWDKIDDPDIKTKIIKDVNLRKMNNWKDNSKKYIPNPTSYLKNERWNDEVMTSSEIKSTVQFFGPGHPTYDMMHENDYKN